MKKTIILIAALVPALAFGAKESAVKQFDRLYEKNFYEERERVNPTTREMKDIAQSQGTLTKLTKQGQGLAAPSATGTGNRPVNMPPAPSYRTMGDAANAGVDPLQLLKSMEVKTPVEEASRPDPLLIYGGGFGVFALLGIIVFFLLNRNRGIRAD